MSSKPWRLVAAGETLRDQVNRRFPNRDKTSDGTIGDLSHQGRPSDHNPDRQGWVHALDLDADLGEPGAIRRLADQLAACARAGRDGGRILNLVYADQVASGTYPDTFWEFRGSGYGHRGHLHVSFTDAAERDGSPFPLPIFSPPPPPFTREEPEMILLRNASTQAVALLSGALFTVLTDDRSAGKLQDAGVKLVDLPATDWNRLNQEGA